MRKFYHTYLDHLIQIGKIDDLLKRSNLGLKPWYVYLIPECMMGCAKAIFRSNLFVFINSDFKYFKMTKEELLG